MVWQNIIISKMDQSIKLKNITIKRDFLIVKHISTWLFGTPDSYFNALRIYKSTYFDFIVII